MSYFGTDQNEEHKLFSRCGVVHMNPVLKRKYLERKWQRRIFENKDFTKGANMCEMTIQTF